jgi:hypothetical protein
MGGCDEEEEAAPLCTCHLRLVQVLSIQANTKSAHTMKRLQKR